MHRERQWRTALAASLCPNKQHLNRLTAEGENVLDPPAVLFTSTHTVRLNVEENQLVNVFGEFGICLGGLKSA